MKLALLLASLVPLGACRTGLFDLDDDAGAKDLSAPVCAAQHTRETTPLVRIEQVDPAPFVVGRAVRVRAVYELRANCDLPGTVDATSVPNMTTFSDVHVEANYWRASDPSECGATVETARVLVLSDLGLTGASGVAVVDIAPGATVRASFTFVGIATPSGAAAERQPCHTDADCEGRDALLRCIPTTAQAGICHRSCTDNVDCSGGRETLDGACTPQSVCDRDVLIDCALPRACGFGQTCTSGELGIMFCLPSQTGTPDGPCACDADCGLGGVCARTEDLSFCRLPCGADDECPSSLRCIASACTS